MVNERPDARPFCYYLVFSLGQLDDNIASRQALHCVELANNYEQRTCTVLVGETFPIS